MPTAVALITEQVRERVRRDGISLTGARAPGARIDAGVAGHGRANHGVADQAAGHGVADQAAGHGVAGHGAASRAVIDRYVLEEVQRYSERALGGSLPMLLDERQAAREIIASITGFGALQPFFDDPDIEDSCFLCPISF
jgi:hypothetical protein